MGAGFRDYKSRQEGFQIGAKRLQIGTGISNRGKRDFKSGQGLQIGAEQPLHLISSTKRSCNVHLKRYSSFTFSKKLPKCQYTVFLRYYCIIKFAYVYRMTTSTAKI